MSGRRPGRPVRPPPPVSTALVLGVGGLFGYVASLPHLGGVAIALLGAGLAAGLRSTRSARVRAVAPIPLVVSVGLLAVVSPLGLVPEVLSGAAGLSILVWLADDPARAPGGVGRAGGTIVVPALALGIAGASALLLPSTSASVGVAAGLLVLALAALAFLFARPRPYDREEAATY